MKKLTLGSLFDGSGGFPLGGLICGIEPIWSSEILPFAIRVTTKRLPQVKHYGDISKLNGADLPPVDIITFGSPCQSVSIAGRRDGIKHTAHGDDVTTRSGLFFEAVRVIKEMRCATNNEYPRYAVWENVCFSADTLVTCRDGYKRIADVAVGDEVKTLSGKYYPVGKVHITKRQPVMNLSVSGSEDLRVTPNHPFWARKKLDRTGKAHISEPKWIKAEDLSPKHYIGYRLDEPTLPLSFISADEAWVLGRWIADGSVDVSKNSPRMFISCGLKKAEILREYINRLPYTIHENYPHKTAINFCFTSAEFYTLIKSCGKGAGNKQIPPFVFSLPIERQKNVLEGYLSGDGFIRNRHGSDEIAANTASRILAYGICRLIRNVYHVGANISVRPPKDGKIGDRVIHANYPSYAIDACVTITNKSRSFYEGGFVWQPVKSVTLTEDTERVYNLSVLEDNTYEANDISVHNCGVFSSNNGEDFRTVLKEICSIKETDVHIPRPEKKWHYAGEIVGNGYSVAWRTLDAQYFNVPQRRARCFLVGDFGGTSAAKILFESESLSGYSSESCGSWKETAAAIEKGTGTASGENGTSVVLCDQGGYRIDVYDNMTAKLRSQARHPTIIMESAGFCTEHSAKSRSIGYEKEVSPTLRAGTVPAALSYFSNHSQDTRYTGPEEISQTVLSTFGTGGNNQPFVVESKAFAICSKESNSMKSDNPGSGFYETDTARTIDTSNQSPVKNQGGIAIVENIKNYDVRITSEGTKNARQNVYETETARTIDTGKNSPDSNQGGIAVVSIQGSMIGRKDENGPQGSGVNEDISFSLTKADRHAVAYGIDRAAFNQGQNALYNFAVEEELEPTIVAKGPGAVAQPTYCTSKNSHHTKANVNIAGTLVESDYKDPPIINDTAGVEYIVRRLTPKECAKLMGFSPDWCSDLGTENPTPEDIAYWREIFNEYNRAIGKNTKPKSDNQIIKWLKNPHSDSAEYAMWGNGVVLMCVCFVLSGIVYFDALDSE